MVAPVLFDPSLCRLRYQRAKRLSESRPVTGRMLLKKIADDLTDRLASLRRRFDTVLCLDDDPIMLSVFADNPQFGQVFHATLDEAFHPGDFTRTGLRPLPFAPDTFDLIVSPLGLQFINDLPGAFIHLRRLLRPDSWFLGCLVGGQSLQELRASFFTAESHIWGGASARIAPFADVRDVGALLQRAQFDSPVSDVDRIVVRYPSAYTLMNDLRELGFSNVLAHRSRRPLSRDLLAAVVASYAEVYSDHDRVIATFDVLWFSGWRSPSVTQEVL